MEQKCIILASASPRRQELLKKIGLVFTTAPSDIPEEIPPGSRPEEMVEAISAAKAEAAARQYPDALIIAADTIGVIGDRVIGKPHSAEDAKKMLRAISGRSHRVITGLTILDSGTQRTVTRTVETRVYVKKLTPEEIDLYVKTGEPLDKAGAYAIQGLGAVLVERISGDYYNVVGLPLNALAEALKEFGINILQAGGPITGQEIDRGQTD